MAHLEMSLTEPFAVPASEVADVSPDDLIPSTVEHWAPTNAYATEQCLSCTTPVA